MKYADVNKELLTGFIDESIDSLSAVDSLFIQLENNPSDVDIVNAIFRPVHSLKGNAAYFGLMRLKKLAHSMENLLDQVRKKQRTVDSELINTLLPGVDYLRNILKNVREDNDEIDNEKEYKDLVNKIEVMSGVTGKDTNTVGYSVKDLLEKLKELCSDAHPELFQKLVKLLSSVPQLAPVFAVDNSADAERISIFQKSISELESLLRSKDISNSPEWLQKIESLIFKLQINSRGENDRNLIDEMIDIYETFKNSDVGLDDLAISMILEKTAHLINRDTPQDRPENSQQSQQNITQKSVPDSKARHDKTMRIPEEALDEFLRYVGELLGVEEMLRHLMRQLSDGTECAQLFSSMKEAVTQFEGISRELRSRIMEIRKVEAKQLLQKVPRIVRDIATQSNKKINVICTGEEIAIDKSYIDLLDAPLTHMVRNAADHGIELPEIRVSSGKPESGTISVSLAENDELLMLSIKDDGAGLNYEGLHRKGVELGIVDENTKLSNSEVTDLLFMSGVSTASVVTDISGRGVGMDVVKRAVLESGGKIDVSSSPGAGTSFTVTLPRNASTQILDAYVVKSFSGEVYVFPLNNVIESFSLSPDQVSDVTGKGKVISRRGTLNPVYVLDDLVGLTSVKHDNEICFSDMGVLVETKTGRNVIAVKEIIGIQKVVSKKVDGGLLDITQFDGAAVSGTGHIYMIINIEKLFSMQQISAC